MRRDQFSGVASIAANGTTSNAIDISSFAFGSVTMPAAFTGTTFSYQVANFPQNLFSSPDDWTWGAPYDADGNAVGAVTFSASRTIQIPPAVFAFRKMRIVSNDTEVSAREFLYTLKG